MTSPAFIPFQSSTRQVDALDLTGATDAGPFLQRLADAGKALTLPKSPGAVILIASPVCFRDPDPNAHLLFDFGGATLVFDAAGLPAAADFTPDPARVWALWSNSDLDSSQAKASTGPRVPRLELRNFRVDGRKYLGAAGYGAQQDVGVRYGDNDAAHIHHFHAQYLPTLTSWRNYADGNHVEHGQITNQPKTDAAGNPITTALVQQWKNGDMLRLAQLKGFSGTILADLSKSNGARILGCIGGQVKLTQCSNVVIEGNHVESDQSTNALPSLVVDCSDVIVRSGVYFASKQTPASSHASIILNDSSATAQFSSHVQLEGVKFLHYLRSTDGDAAVTSDIHITAANGSSRITARDCFGSFGFQKDEDNAGKSPHYPDAIVLTSDDATVAAAVTAAGGEAALACGSFDLHRAGAGGAWELTRPTHSVLRTVRAQSTGPTLNSVFSTSTLLPGGAYTPGTVVSYALVLEDAMGRQSAVSAEVQVTVDAGGAVGLLPFLRTGIDGAVAILCRKVGGAGAATAPDSYCRIPVTGTTTEWVDTFANVAMRPWVAAAGYVPPTSSRSTCDALVMPNGTRILSGTGAPNGLHYGSPPDLYLRADGGAATTLYVKESGVLTSSGWVAK